MSKCKNCDKCNKCTNDKCKCIQCSCDSEVVGCADCKCEKSDVAEDYVFNLYDDYDSSLTITDDHPYLKINIGIADSTQEFFLSFMDAEELVQRLTDYIEDYKEFIEENKEVLWIKV